MDFIDLRSDTVTHPTPAMREAMARAEVGDDVLGEDPTVNRLEEMVASMAGKQAGLLMPSGTMSNLAAILTHCGRGDEVILGDKAHTVLFEAGGISALGGIHSRQIPNQADGTMDLADITAAIRSDDIHYPPTRLISIENTHNRCGGVPLSAAYTRSVGDLAQKYNIKLHIDGARLFNAAIAQGVSAADLAAPADSVSICLSKGLCAPVGSVLCGSFDFIQSARRIRKQLGGGMRQAGILAAAGIVALETMVDRLAEDHQRARLLAQGLNSIDGLILNPGTPQTNMIFCRLSDRIPFDAKETAVRLAAKGIKAGVVAERGFRLVLHYWITDADVEKTVRAFGEVLDVP
ncbi:MAG: low-specificity L-threonine aldolase [Chloroflexi bacterium]|nr:low-specificity L-threonine aldolase [Chloroflexota bacterium]